MARRADGAHVDHVPTQLERALPLQVDGMAGERRLHRAGERQRLAGLHGARDGRDGQRVFDALEQRCRLSSRRSVTR